MAERGVFFIVTQLFYNVIILLYYMHYFWFGILGISGCHEITRFKHLHTWTSKGKLLSSIVSLNLPLIFLISRMYASPLSVTCTSYQTRAFGSSSVFCTTNSGFQKCLKSVTFFLENITSKVPIYTYYLGLQNKHYKNV